MRLIFQGNLVTGVQMLDQGITDLAIRVGDDGAVHVYATTGRNGGLSGYAIRPDGSVLSLGQSLFPPSITQAVSDRLMLGSTPGGDALFFSAGASALVGLALNGAGALGGSVGSTWTQVRQDMPGTQWMSGHADLTNLQLAQFPGQYACDQIVALDTVTVGTNQYVVSLCTARNGLTVFAADSTGRLMQVSAFGQDQGAGIAAPTDMALVQVGGQTYAIVTGGASSSLSVLRVEADGRLVPTELRLDTASTTFRNAQVVEAISVGDHCFVVTGGADGGLTLYQLLPDGRLVFVQAIADTGATSLDTVTALALAVSGDSLHIVAGSQNDQGLSRFTIDLSTLGARITGTAAAETLAGGNGSDVLISVGRDDTLLGGGGDDILLANGDGTRLTGGAGNDIFVVRHGIGTVTITDFRPGQDRLDLSDFPMLRDLSQLTLTITGNGANLTYRGTIIRLIGDPPRPLTLSDIFPDGLTGGDRVPILPVNDEDLPGFVRLGSRFRDVFNGSDRGDTLSGSGGNDFLLGLDGNDVLRGDDGHDNLHGGAGDDIIMGGTGFDRVIAGDGNDVIYGEADNDQLYGMLGDDTLYGGAGDDLLHGGPGDDVLYLMAGANIGIGGVGNDTIHGGTGNDRIWAHDGADVVYGGNGDDLVLLFSGNDVADGGAGNDFIVGDAGDDSLRGGDGDDTLIGNIGDDTLEGGWGNDRIDAGPGNDAINGGPGNDTLVGSAGFDHYWAGAGADTFLFHAATGSLVIHDFALNQGDSLLVSQRIWASAGTLSETQVLDQFARFDAWGNAVLDFSSIGGPVWTIGGLTTLDDLAAALVIT